MKIEAYVCTECDTIYHTKKESTACVRKCKSAAKTIAKELADEEAVIALRNYARLNATSISHFEELLTYVGEKLYGGKFYVKFRNMRFCEEVSNSHDSPIGAPTNWCAHDKNIPSSYPGFQGDITITTKGCKKPGTWTESYFDKWYGISGVNKCNSQVKLFLQDFPLIEVNVVEYKRLKNVLVYETNAISGILKSAIDVDETVRMSNVAISKLDEEVMRITEELRQIKLSIDYKVQAREAHIDVTYRNDATAKKKKLSDTFQDWVKTNIGVQM